MADMLFVDHVIGKVKVMILVCSKCNAVLEKHFERRNELYIKPCGVCKQALLTRIKRLDFSDYMEMGVVIKEVER